LMLIRLRGLRFAPRPAYGLPPRWGLVIRRIRIPHYEGCPSGAWLERP